MAAAKSKVPSTHTKLEKEALRALARLGGQLLQEDDLEYGDKFVLPRTMSVENGIRFLQNKLKEENEEVNWSRKFPYRPFDGAHALVSAIRKHFGTLRHVPTPGFFGPTPPQLIDVEVGFGITEPVPWGTFSVPAIPGVTIETGAKHDPDLGQIFYLTGYGLKKHTALVMGLFKLVEDELRENSIYKGQAIDAGWSFLDTGKVNREHLVYAEDVMAQLEANVLAPIRYPEQLAEAGVELKSAVLLHGTYGVGKTMWAYVTAQEAVANGVTFIQVRPGKDDLHQAMAAAKMYAPAVVFFEDLDTIATPEGEADRISELLELFDGVRAKGVPVMAILTTNHADKIHKGMVRPGRLDAVIEVTAPDAEGIIKLCKTLVPEHLLSDAITRTEWEAVAAAADGYIPAFVHEGCKRAIKYAIVRGNGNLDGVQITGEDLRLAMEGLRTQYDMMDEARDTVEVEPFGAAARNALRPLVEELITRELDPVHQYTGIFPDRR